MCNYISSQFLWFPRFLLLGEVFHIETFNIEVFSCWWTPKSYILRHTKFWVAGSLFFLMGTAAIEYPYGITAHSRGKFGQKLLDTSSSKFPYKVGFSRTNLYESSASITNSKVCKKVFYFFYSFNYMHSWYWSIFLAEKNEVELFEVYVCWLLQVFYFV